MYHLKAIVSLCLLTIAVSSTAIAFDGTIIISNSVNKERAVITVPITESPETLPDTIRFSVTLDGLVGGDKVSLAINNHPFFGAIVPASPENQPRAGHFSSSIDTDHISYGDNTITVTLKTTRSKYQVSCRNLELKITPWEVPYCQYRIPIEVDVKQAGMCIMNLTPDQICTAIERHEEYSFDPQFLAYNHLYATQIDDSTGKHELLDDAGFTLITDAENLAADPAKPIPTTKGDYYLVTFESEGGMFPPTVGYEQVFPVGLPPRTHAYMSSYMPRLLPKAKSTHECLLRSDGTDLKLTLINTTVATNIRVHHASIAYVANFAETGRKSLQLYYQPLGAHYLKIPNRRLTHLPDSTATVQHVGESQKRIGNTRYRLPSTDGFEPWFAETTVKLTPQTSAPTQRRDQISLSAAGNESQSFQLVLKPNIDFEIEQVSISALRQGRHKITDTEVFQIEYVPVTKKARINQVTHRGTIGDPLVPVQTVSRMASEGNLAYWFTIRVPTGTPAGLYSGVITVKGSDPANASIPVSLKVQDFELPEFSTFKSHMGGQYIAKKAVGDQSRPVMDYHSVSAKEDIKKLANIYFTRMSKEKFYPKTVALFTEIGLKWKPPPKGYKVDTPGNFFKLYDWDFSEFNEQMRYFIDELKVNSVCLNHTNPSVSHIFKHLPGKPAQPIRFHPGHTTMAWQTFRQMNQATYKTKPEGGWHDTCLEVSVAQWDRLVLDYYREICRNLKKHGWIDKFYYLVDETSNTEQILHLIRLLKSDPETAGLRFAHCLQGFESLWHREDGKYAFADLITHVPQIDENYYRWEEYFFDDYDFPRDRNRLWSYAAYSSRLGINVPGMTNRQVGLEMFNIGGSGYVIWDTFMYDHTYGEPDDPKNPWKEPYASLANGAISYFYPPKRDGFPEEPDFSITPSLRIMTFRESVDDYEYARILEDLIERAERASVECTAAKQVISDIRLMFPGRVEWTLNDAWYADLRERMANGITALAKRLP